jgi:hypothetical protein
MPFSALLIVEALYLGITLQEAKLEDNMRILGSPLSYGAYASDNIPASQNVT